MEQRATVPIQIHVLVEMMPDLKGDTEPSIVLVVDDEAPVRLLARRILEEEGYAVIEASDAMQAIGLLVDELRLDLLIADLEMPGLSGDEMVRRVRATRPDLKVLYVTGYIDRLLDARPLWQGEAFLDKPFSVIGLRQAVALLLYGSITKTRR
jgi:CheY-like chemotaxis protein